MKFFLAIVLIASVASAAIIKPTAVSGELAEIQEIIAAIQSPSTDPATAAALEEMLDEILGVKPDPIAVGPAIIEADGISVGPAIIDADSISVGPAIIDADAISVGPAIIDFPLPENDVIAPSPAVVGPTPLVQIIVNINQAALEGGVVAPGPVVMPEPVIIPDPVIIVDSAPEPVQVVETAPVPAEPVVIGTPVLPAPAVTLPEELN